MALAAQRGLFSRSRVLPTPPLLLPHPPTQPRAQPPSSQTPRASLGVLSGDGKPFKPHGQVELILEAQPPLKYHGHMEPRVLSPVKGRTADEFRELHPFVMIIDLDLERRS